MWEINEWPHLPELHSENVTGWLLHLTPRILQTYDELSILKNLKIT